jgi:hypothetical protein
MVSALKEKCKSNLKEMCYLLHHCLYIDLELHQTQIHVSQHKLSNPPISMEQTSSLKHKVNSYISTKIVEYFQ